MSAFAVDVLTAIYAAGGTVRIAGEDRLKVSAPVPLPNALMDRLRAVKPDVNVVAVRRSGRLDRRRCKSGRWKPASAGSTGTLVRVRPRREALSR